MGHQIHAQNLTAENLVVKEGKPRVAVVIQRYGNEISGGAELLCRLVMERLTQWYDLTILTTCAQDYVTWRNEYAPGVGDVNGIPVKRFPTIQERAGDFGQQSAWIYEHTHTLADEWAWLEAQGPHAPELLTHISQNHLAYDAFIFFGYLYYPTTLGLRLAANRAIFVPTAHDEPPIYLKMFQALFHAPRAIVYNTPEEKQVAESIFGVGYIPNRVAGIGIDLPTKTDAAEFRAKFQIDVPYIIYVGRVSESKSCQILLDFFVQYKENHPNVPLDLVLIGKSELPIPERNDIHALGYLSEQDKWDAIAGSEAFVLPSQFESLSIALLESLGIGIPVLCNGASDVLRGHCLRSNAALYYNTYREFELGLQLLTQHPLLKARFGSNGKEYVQENYAWVHTLQQYRDMIEMVIQNPW